MRILSLIYVFLSFFSLTALAVSPFEEANTLFNAGKYQASAILYEKELVSKGNSFEIHFNLGCAYYKLGQMAPAVLHFEKAKLIQPTHKELNENLALVRSKLYNRFENKETDSKRFASVPSNYWTFGYWVCWWLGAGLLFLGIRRKSVSLHIIAIMLGVIGLYMIYSAKKKAGIERGGIEAIVFEKKIPLLAAPESESTPTFELREGAKVSIKQEADGWMKVGLPNGEEGWLPIKSVKKI